MPSSYNAEYYNKNKDRIKAKELSAYHFKKGLASGETQATEEYKKYGEHFALIRKAKKALAEVQTKCPSFLTDITQLNPQN
jgi:hypothetical protein